MSATVATLARAVHLPNAWEDTHTHPFKYPLDLPAGTALRPTIDGLGRVTYAVADATLVARLTGNAHDARHRYVFVPDDAVALPPLPVLAAARDAALSRFHACQDWIGRARGRALRDARDAFHAAAHDHAAACAVYQAAVKAAQPAEG